MFITDIPDITTNIPDNDGGIQNEGQQCWDQCGHKNGDCDWCGSEGMCCRQGGHWAKDGCDGSVGGHNRHECAKKPTVDNSGTK